MRSYGAEAVREQIMQFSGYGLGLNLARIINTPPDIVKAGLLCTLMLMLYFCVVVFQKRFDTFQDVEESELYSDNTKYSVRTRIHVIISMFLGLIIRTIAWTFSGIMFAYLDQVISNGMYTTMQILQPVFFFFFLFIFYIKIEEMSITPDSVQQTNLKPFTSDQEMFIKYLIERRVEPLQKQVNSRARKNKTLNTVVTDIPIPPEYTKKLT